MPTERTSWEIRYLVGKRQTEALARGLLVCGGQLLDSAKLPHESYPRDTWHVKIVLPVGKVKQFIEVTHLTLYLPLQVDLPTPEAP